MGRHAGEIAESFEIHTALEVALIERKDKPETLPLGIDKPLLLNKILKKNQFAQGTVYVRPAAVFEGSQVWNPA